MSQSLTEQFPLPDTIFVGGYTTSGILRADNKEKGRLFTTDMVKNNTVLGVLSRAAGSNVGGILHLIAPPFIDNETQFVENIRKQFDDFHAALIKESGYGRHYECVLFGPHAFPGTDDNRAERASRLLYQTISRKVQVTPQFYPPHLVDSEYGELILDVRMGTISHQQVTADNVIGFMKRNPDAYEGADILFPELKLGR